MAAETGRKHRRTRFAALLMVVLAGSLGMGQTAQAADKCMTSKEMRSERVRALQSALMFAALKCVHKPSLGLNTKYNEIMRRHAKDLAVHSKVVQDYFRRTGGRSHRQKLHKYVTSMANRYSVVSFQEPRFCEEMSDLGSSILNGEYDVIQNARFEQRMLLPQIAPICKSEDNRMMVMNSKVPDLVSIHMPDVDHRIRQKLAEGGE